MPRLSTNDPMPIIGLNLVGDGVKDQVPFGTVKNIDFKIAGNPKFLSGSEFYTKNSVIGDFITVQIVDVDNILGGGAGMVVRQLINKFYVFPDQQMILELPFSGRIPKDLYLRLKYTSIGAALPVDVLCNYLLFIRAGEV